MFKSIERRLKKMDETKENQANESISQNTAEASRENKSNGLPYIEELRTLKAELTGLKEGISEEVKKLEVLRGEQILAGTNGEKVEPEKPKEDSPVEYVQKVLNGEVGEEKD